MVQLLSHASPPSSPKKMYFRHNSTICLLATFVLAAATQLGCVPPPVATSSKSQSEAAKASPDAGNASSSTAERNLETRLRDVLDTALTARTLSTEVNAAWQIMHGVVCFGDRLMVQTPDRGEVSALEYAFSGGAIRGLEIQPGDILPTSKRRGVKARLDPGSSVGQGHVDQWIAICAMCDLPPDTPIQLGEQTFTVEDWARQAQYDVSDNYLDEYGWTLIALTHYLPEETSWVAKDGNTYTLEDLLASEIQIDLATAACGGTHSLAGVVRALDLKEKANLPDSETWMQARALVDDCIDRARRFRASDGRLSASYFDRSAVSVDLSVELSSAGHVFEFLALAIPDSELGEPWMESAVSRVCNLLESAENVDLECGGLYHALNGLKIYLDRRYAS